MQSLPWVDHDSILANVSIEQVGFDLKSPADFDEAALLKAIDQEFPGSSVLKKPQAQDSKSRSPQQAS